MKNNFILKILRFISGKLNIKFVVLVVCFICLTVHKSNSQGLAGAFLQNSQDAVESAFCGITPLHSTSSQIIFSNASLIANCPNTSLALGHSSFGFGEIPNTGQFNLTFSKNISMACFGVGFRSYAVSTTQTNERGQAFGIVKASDYDAVFSSALKIANANLGASLHYIRRDVSGNIIGGSTPDMALNGASLGLSGSMNFGDLLLGASINNIATQIANSQTNTKAEIPVNMRVVGGYYFLATDNITEVKTNASGISEEIYSKPTSYLYTTLQAEISNLNYHTDFVWAFAADYLADKDIPVAIRAGMNTLGDYGLGLSIYYSAGKPMFGSFGKNFSIDIAARKEYYLNNATFHFTFGIN